MAREVQVTSRNGACGATKVSVLRTLPRDHAVQLSSPSGPAYDQGRSRHKGWSVIRE